MGRPSAATRDAGPFGLEVRAEPSGRVHVALRGELDLSSVPVLEAAVADALGGASHGITLDLARLEFIDASGVAVLGRARRDVAARGGEMGMCDAQAEVRRILTLCAREHWLTPRDPEPCVETPGPAPHAVGTDLEAIVVSSA